MTEPVVASVSEPVRAKRPTLYGVLLPREIDAAIGGDRCGILHLNAGELTPMMQQMQTETGALLITIPGETDDAPPATAKELANKVSEPPDNLRDVLMMCHGKLAIGWCGKDTEWVVDWRDETEINAPVTSWEELPEKPK